MQRTPPRTRAAAKRHPADAADDQDATSSEHSTKVTLPTPVDDILGASKTLDSISPPESLRASPTFDDNIDTLADGEISPTAKSPSGSLESGSFDVLPLSLENPGGQATMASTEIKPPHFTKTAPEMWFNIVDQMLKAANVTEDNLKYLKTLSYLGDAALLEMSDIISTTPELGKYDYLKNKAIARFAASTEEKLGKLFGDLTIGNKKPSVLLREMTALAQGQLENDALLHKWSSMLPEMVRLLLQTQDNKNLDEIGRFSDQLMAILSKNPTVFAASPAPGPIPTVAAASYSEPTAAKIDVLAQLVNQLVSSNMQLLGEIRALTQQRNNNSGPRDCNGGHNQDRGRNRSRSQSRRRTYSPTAPGAPGKCFYHHRFGAAATKCYRPCSMETQPLAPINKEN